MDLIYKICPASLWQAAEQAGSFAGAEIDLKDGYIHFSTAEQARETAAKHFAGQSGLVIAAIDPARLGGGLKWEPARGGRLFPHLYGPLPLSAVVWARPLPLDANGTHAFPAGMP